MKGEKATFYAFLSRRGIVCDMYTISGFHYILLPARLQYIPTVDGLNKGKDTRTPPPITTYSYTTHMT